MNDGSGKNGPSNVRSLTDAMRKVRVAESERTDVVVELRDAERARLDILADELRSVFAEIPEDNEQFICEVSGGIQPRFWVDVTSFVTMGRDRRTYRFLKDTRLGRTVILETPDLDDVADCITQYVAERILERERALEGDWLAKRIAGQDGVAKSEKQPSRFLRGLRPQAAATRSFNTGWILSAFLGGVLAGMIALLAYAWIHIAV